MVVLLVLSGLLLVALVVLLGSAPRHHPAHPGGMTVHLQPVDLEPTSRAGTLSLLAVLAAVALQLLLPYAWAMTPLGALAALLSLYAMTAHQDRSPLLFLSLVVGLFAVFFPLSVWLLSPT